MADVFISYSKRDADKVGKIADYIKNNTDLTVWWDTELLGGDQYRSEIRRQIGLARVVLVLWTKESIKSEWVQEEADEATRFNKYIPLFGSSINPGLEIPFGLKSVQALPVGQKQHILETLSSFLNNSELNTTRVDLESFKYVKKISLIATLFSVTSLLILQFAPHFYLPFIIGSIAIFTSHAFWPRTYKIIKKARLEPLITLKRMHLNHRYIEVAIPLLLLFVLTFSLPKLINSISDSVFEVKILPVLTQTKEKKEEKITNSISGFEKFYFNLKKYSLGVIGLVIFFGIPYLFFKATDALLTSSNMKIWNNVSPLDSGNRFEYMDSYRLFFQNVDVGLNYFYILLFHPFILSVISALFLYDMKAPSPIWLYLLSSCVVSSMFIYLHYRVKRPIYL